MYGRLYKNIGFSLIIFAFLFLFDPNYGLIDVLPDFIGYIILCFALINLADIDEKIYSAFKMFRIGAIIGVVKIITIIIFKLNFSAEEQLIFSAVIIFVSMIADAIIMIGGFKMLFEGLLNLGIFEGGEAVHKKTRENGKNATEKIYILTIIFVLYKAIICAIPEFSSLQSNSQYEFVHVLRWFAITLVLPFSLYWLVRQIIYFTRLKKDRPFIEALSQKYITRAEAHPEFYLCRVLFVGLGGVVVAILFSLNLYFENVNYLPNAFFFILVIAFIFFLRKYSAKWKFALLTAIPGVLFSLFLFFVEGRFFERHHIGAIMRDAEAYVMYYFMLVLYVVVALLTIAVVVFVAMVLKDIFTNHGRNDLNQKDNMSGFNIRAIFFVLLGATSAVGNVGYMISLPYWGKLSFLEYSGIVSFVLSIAFIFSAFVLYYYIIGEIKYKYKKYLI